MTQFTDKHAVPIVTACMTKNGLPTFAMNTVEVTDDEIANGIHLYLVEADLLLAGYEEPFVHFPRDEAPPFLHPAVAEYLDNSNQVLAEEPLHVPSH